MPEIIHCPRCQRRLQVPEELLGQEVQCPTCEAIFEASQVAGTPRPREEPATQPRPERGDDEPRERPLRRRRFEDYEDDEYDDEDSYRRGPRRDLVPHRGAMILVFGILSLLAFLVCLPMALFGPVAWAMGSMDLSEIRAGRMDPDGEGMTNAGRICGIIATVLLLIGILLCGAFFGVRFLTPGRR
jgi:hypothetical protein